MSEEPQQPKSKPRRRSRIAQVASVLALVIVLVLVWYFLGPKPNKAANRQRAEVVPVEIATATTMDVPVQIKSIGNVESIQTVAVRSQVEGTLQAVHFTPGQEVKKGDLLFTIDPRPMQATVAQASANLAKAVAAVDQGRQVSTKDQAQATTPLVTITQSSPIYVTFTVPEPDFLRIREYASHADFRTEVSIPGSSQPSQQGKLSLIDNTVDTTTGTIRLKATFENKDELLYP